MKTEKKQTKEDKKPQKEKEPKKEIFSIASVFRKLGQQGAKDRKDLAEKIVKYLADKGITENVKNKPIMVENVTSQIGAMIKDINDKRGKEKNSWWSQFVVEENDNSLKIKKAVA